MSDYLTIEIAFGQAPFNITWGTATDVTADFRAVSGGPSKRTSEFESFSAGSMRVVLDNQNRDYDPGYGSSPYAGQFDRATPIRIRGNGPSGDVNQFVGFIRDFRVEYPNANDSICVIEALDGLWLLAEHFLSSITASYGGDKVETRIGRVLDEAGWPSADRDLEKVSTSLQTTEYGRPALAEIQAAAQADGGVFFHDPEDGMRFDGRTSIGTRSSYTTSAVTFDGTSEPTFLHGTLRQSAVGEAFRNLVQITPEGLTTQEVDNTPANTPSRSYEKTLRMETELQASALANFVADGYGTETPYFQEFRVLAAVHDAKPRDDVFDLGPRDRVTVSFDPPGAGGSLSHDLLLSRIHHDITPSAWHVTLRGESADAFDNNLTGPPGNWLILDHAGTRDELDSTNVLGY